MNSNEQRNETKRPEVGLRLLVNSFQNLKKKKHNESKVRHTLFYMHTQKEYMNVEHLTRRRREKERREEREQKSCKHTKQQRNKITANTCINTQNTNTNNTKHEYKFHETNTKHTYCLRVTNVFN